MKAYKSQEAKHSNVKQANEITLERIKNEAQAEVADEVESEKSQDVTEKEHLLAQEEQCQRQRQQQQQQQQEKRQETQRDEIQQKLHEQQLPLQQNARANFQQHGNKTAVAVVVADYDDYEDEACSAYDDAFVDDDDHDNDVGITKDLMAVVSAAKHNKDDDDDDDAAARKQLQSSSIAMTQYGNTGSHTHSPLDIQKFPTERQHQHEMQQRHYNEQNVATITPTPTSLYTTTAAEHNNRNATIAGGGGSSGGAASGAVAGIGHNSPAHTNYKGPKIWHFLVKHWPALSENLALLGIFLLIWTLAYILLPDYAVPETAIMRIFFLFIGAQITGMLVTLLRLPDMLGMLFFGVLYTNVGLADFSGYQRFEAFLREMALINIMLLAGLGLDAKAFKTLWLMIMRLTLIPTIAEVIVIAVLARYLLAMPWLWGTLLGLVVTAVSPNVVVTVMLKLKEDRLGLNNGIHTLIYAMTSCNDVVAIFLFGCILGVIFSTSSLTQQILQGPIGIGIGVVFGYVYGLMLQFLPAYKTNFVNGLRFILTILGGTISVMGSKAIGYPSAGALGCMTIAFIAGIGWKRHQQKLTPQQQQSNENCSVAKRLDLLWKFLKPVSFALIGKEINFAVLDGKVVGYGVILVLLGSLFRLAFAYISTYGGNLSRKERAYITISGFPKATVQAALGPIALDLARSLNADQQNLSLANNVLVISVLAIILTAPLGAILMLRLAPRWLQHSSEIALNIENGYHGSNGSMPGVEGGVNFGFSADMMNASPKFAKNLSYRSTKSQNTIDVAVAAGNAGHQTSRNIAVADGGVRKNAPTLH